MNIQRNLKGNKILELTISVATDTNVRDLGITYYLEELRVATVIVWVTET